MYITYNPLFKLTNALTQKKYTYFKGEAWTTKTNSRIVIFSRGQWALKAIAASEMKKRGKEKAKIYIPDYFCEISLTPLRKAGFDLCFYRIAPNFEPDIAHLRKLKERHGTPDVLLFVHYFGFPQNILDTQNWCEENGVVIVEDAAHSLIPIPGIGDNGNPVFYTPWKFINIPAGAFLVLPELSDYIETEPSEKNGHVSFPLKWVLRQEVCSISQRIRLPLHQLRGASVKGHDVSEPIVAPESSLCSPFSINLLGKYEKDIKDVCLKRKRNYRLIDEVFLDPNFKQYRIFKDVPVSFAPYVYPFRIPAKHSVNLMINLNKKGIPASPWSDLSPEVKNSEEYPLSNDLRKEIVTLPIHQDLSLSQINWMKKQVLSCLEKLKTKASIYTSP
ncbi:MAG: hypothetical protein ABIB93_01105 [Chloroflexota bacterium]